MNTIEIIRTYDTDTVNNSTKRRAINKLVNMNDDQTAERICEALYISWKTAHELDAGSAWHTLTANIEGIKEMVIYSLIPVNDREAVLDDLHMLWGVALARSSAAKRFYCESDL